MSRIIKLENIADFNASAINKHDSFSEINYLDTGSITRNVIDSYQNLKVGIDGIPSRAKRKVKDKTIIYSTVRPNQEHFGFMVNPLDNLIVSTGFCTIDINDDGIDPKYIYYLITQPHITVYLHTIGMNSVSAYPSINPSDIANLNFQIPEFEEQQKIASVLSTLDEKIALNNQINATLEQMAKTLYDYWFVQFDFPDDNGKPYKSSGGEMVYNETLKREIPKGWEIITLGKITICHDSKRVPLSSQQRLEKQGEYPYYGATGIFDFIDDYIFDGDYVLMAEDGSVMDDKGNPILQRIYGKTWVNNHAHVLEPISDYTCYLLMLLLKDVSVKKIKTGSIQMKINQENMNNIPLVSIPEDLKNKINNILLDLDKQLISIKKQNIELIKLRDWLLPMLMNGQVTVQ